MTFFYCRKLQTFCESGVMAATLVLGTNALKRVGSSPTSCRKASSGLVDFFLDKMSMLRTGDLKKRVELTTLNFSRKINNLLP